MWYARQAQLLMPTLWFFLKIVLPRKSKKNIFSFNLRFPRLNCFPFHNMRKIENSGRRGPSQFSWRTTWRSRRPLAGCSPSKTKLSRAPLVFLFPNLIITLFPLLLFVHLVFLQQGHMLWSAIIASKKNMVFTF